MVNEEIAPLRSTYGATFALICQKIVLLLLFCLLLNITLLVFILLCLIINIFIVNILIPNLCILITFTLNKVRTFSKKQWRGRSNASGPKLSSCSKARASQSRELTKLILYIVRRLRRNNTINAGGSTAICKICEWVSGRMDTP